MNRSELKAFIMETYNTDADHPWLKYLNYEAFRRCGNQRWFALIIASLDKSTYARRTLRHAFRCVIVLGLRQ